MPCRTTSKPTGEGVVGPTNGTTQNGASRKLVIDAGRVESFRVLVAEFVEHYQPASLHEYALVEDLAHHRWFLWSCQRALYSIESEVYAAKPGQSEWSDIELKRLGLAAGYRAQAEAAFHRALKNVDAFMKERVADYRWEAGYDLAVRRLELQKKKLEFAVNDKATHRRNTPVDSAKTAVS